MIKFITSLKYRICLSVLLCLFSSNVYAQEILDRLYEEELGLYKKEEIKAKEPQVIKPQDIRDGNVNVDQFEQIIDPVIPEQPKAQDPNLVNRLEGNMSKILLKRRKLKSLMYSFEEEAAINAALDSLRSGALFLPEDDSGDEIAFEEEVIDNRKSYIYLASILYYGEGNWALWINGEKFTSDSNSPENEIYVQSVTTDEISVLWTISASKWRILLGRKADDQESKINANNQVEAEFRLRPNQTYLLREDQVVEGKGE